MTDRELLELAAKAAGIVVIRSRLHDPLCEDMLIESSTRNPTQTHGQWNPLTDDGDALRLAVKVGLSLRRDSLDVGAFLRVREMNCGELGAEPLNTDPYAATRLAIVRAAAAIGEKMP